MGRPAGDSATISVALWTMKDVADVVPKVTALAPVNPVPVIVTAVPPSVGPDPGLTLVTVGAGRYVYSSFALIADDTPKATTRTSTVPVPAGTCTRSELELPEMPVAFTPPKVTAETPMKLEPVIVITLPPADGPDAGDTLETTGGGQYTN
jgi:hypothetical protein